MKGRVAIVANVYFNEMRFEGIGDVMPSHKHRYDHATMLACGRVRVTVEERVSDYAAPCLIIIKKDRLHRIEALEEGTVAYCIHGIRGEGVDDIVDAESVPAWATQMMPRGTHGER